MSTRHLPALDGLRALSIGLVLASHAGLGAIVPGGLGVTIFFFVSGYLITMQLADEHARTGRIAFGAFYLRRALRLAPAFLVYVLVAGSVATALGAHVEGRAWASTLLQCGNYARIFTHVFATGVAGFAHPFDALWSLAVEEHFYALWPVLLATLLPRGRARTLAALFLLVLTVLAWRAHLAPLCAAGAPVCGVHPADRIYKASDTRIDSLAYGAIAALLPRATASPWRAAAASLALLATLVVRDAAMRDVWRYAIQGAAMVVLIPPLAHGSGGVARLLAGRPARAIGRLSYSLYLWHWLALILASRIAAGGAARVALFALITTASAAFSWHAVERPMLRVRARARAAGAMRHAAPKPATPRAHPIQPWRQVQAPPGPDGVWGEAP